MKRNSAGLAASGESVVGEFLKEKEMLNTFHTIFRPAAAKFPGFIDVQIIKLRAAVMGKAPAGLNYRFVLTYESEELRQKWIASDVHRKRKGCGGRHQFRQETDRAALRFARVHQKVWPPIENTLVSKDYSVLLFDVT